MFVCVKRLLLPPAAGVPIDTRLYIGSAGCVCVQRSPQQAGQTLGARMCSRPEQERANSVPRKGGRQEEALAHGESHAGAKPGRWEGASRAAPRALARGQTNVPAVGGRRSPPRPQLISPPPLAGAAEIPHPWRAGTAGRSAAPNPPPLTIREREAMSISPPAWRRHNSLTRTNKTYWSPSDKVHRGASVAECRACAFEACRIRNRPQRHRSQADRDKKEMQGNCQQKNRRKTE